MRGIFRYSFRYCPKAQQLLCQLKSSVGGVQQGDAIERREPLAGRGGIASTCFVDDELRSNQSEARRGCVLPFLCDLLMRSDHSDHNVA